MAVDFKEGEDYDNNSPTVGDDEHKKENDESFDSSFLFL
jgi:hypothetical protein